MTKEEIKKLITEDCSMDRHGNYRMTEEEVDDLVDELLVAINYTLSCTELKDKKVLSFEEYIDAYYERKDFKYFNKRGKSFKSTEISQIYDEHIHNL